MTDKEKADKSCRYCGNQHELKIIGSAYDHEYKTSKHHFHYGQCSGCKSLQLVDHLDDQQISESYPSNYYSFHLLENRSKYCDTQEGSRFQRNAHKLVRAGIKSAADIMNTPQSELKILDYGAGDGLLLMQLQEIGISPEKIWGLDTYSESQSRVEKAGFNFLTSNSKETQQGTFSLIFANHVIEHLHDPNILFQDAYLLLKKGGILITETPVSEGFHFNVTKRSDWGGYHAPRHLTIPTKIGIGMIAERHSFRCEKSDYIDDSWIWLQTLNSLLERNKIRNIPKEFKQAIATGTKEIPTRERRLLLALLGKISRKIQIFGGKSSVLRSIWISDGYTY